MTLKGLRKPPRYPKRQATHVSVRDRNAERALARVRHRELDRLAALAADRDRA
jgi:hypothetical protein